jgi:uncharacterized protein YbjT (DUF2867 family)
MRVLVIGGYGLIGGYVVADLAAAGHEVIGAGRDIALATRRFPFARWKRADLATFDEADWAPLVEGVDAVVNCAGALQDSPRDNLEAVHVTGVATLARAAFKAGARRLVHISAAGVADGPGAFARTKRAAEEGFERLDIDWVILRPGLVLAPVAFGGSALLRGLAAFPGVVPCVYPDSRVQTVAAEDVALAVRAALRPDAPRRAAVDLVSREAYPLREILVRLRAWLGEAPAPVLALPPLVAGVASAGADALAWLGWRGPMRSASIAQLRHGVRGDPDTISSLPGVKVRNLDQILAAAPAGAQERWFARLYFLKPLGLAVLAIFWALSGLTGLLAVDRAAALLTHAGFSALAARACVILGALADLALAALICRRATSVAALKGMIALSAVYLAAAAVWRPDLWTDPLGPMTKVLPSMVLALALMAMSEAR